MRAGRGARPGSICPVSCTQSQVIKRGHDPGVIRIEGDFCNAQGFLGGGECFGVLAVLIKRFDLVVKLLPAFL